MRSLKLRVMDGTRIIRGRKAVFERKDPVECLRWRFFGECEMIVTFHDRQNTTNPLNARAFEDGDLLINALRGLLNREPFFCELEGEDESNLMIGLGKQWSCVQYSKTNGASPYLVALGENAKSDGDEFLEFLINDEATPVRFRLGLSQDTLWKIVRSFLETGEPSQIVQWEEI